MRMAKLCNQEVPRRDFASSKLVDSDSFLGVEIELEHGDAITAKELSKIQAYFEMDNDDSLRDNGIEFRFKRPYAGKRVVKALNTFEGLEGRVRLGERTSVHVHLDVRDMPINVFSRMMALYLLFEPVFFQVGGDHRRNSIYCWPLGKTEGMTYSIAYDLAHKNQMDYRRFKYAALNIGSMYRFGSVEFRHHEGCVNPTRLLNWINLILNLKKLAYQSRTKKDIAKVLELFSIKDLLAGTTIVLPKAMDLTASREVAEEFIYTYKHMRNETITPSRAEGLLAGLDLEPTSQRATGYHLDLGGTVPRMSEQMRDISERQRQLMNDMSLAGSILDRQARNRVTAPVFTATWADEATAPEEPPLDVDDEEERREPEFDEGEA